MKDKEKAKFLISKAEQSLATSGATIILAKKEMKEIEEKSQENIKKLSFLL